MIKIKVNKLPRDYEYEFNRAKIDLAIIKYDNYAWLYHKNKNTNKGKIK